MATNVFDGRQLTVARALADLTVLGLADAAGVTGRTIHRLEIGGAVHVAAKKRHGHVSRAIWDRILGRWRDAASNSCRRLKTMAPAHDGPNRDDAASPDCGTGLWVAGHTIGTRLHARPECSSGLKTRSWGVSSMTTRTE